MPTYSYRCTECSVAFDIQQAFTDDSLTECPSCAGRLRKVFSAIGVTFNGSGFYRTDSRAGSDKKSSGEKSSGEKSSGESSAKSSGEKAASSASGASSTTTSSPAPAAAN